jgi:hypothetical protein
MNIFVLDYDPVQAAQSQCDKHVVKMILESAQMLCTAHRVHDPEDCNPNIYKIAYVNHPCTVWARETTGNYEWLLAHFIELCYEYTRRYDKIHKCHSLVSYLNNYPTTMPRGHMTPYALCMPQQYKIGSTVESYRRFYMSKQFKFDMRWSAPSCSPVWFIRRRLLKVTNGR